MENTSKQVMLSVEMRVAQKAVELWFRSHGLPVPPDLEPELEALIPAMRDLIPDDGGSDVAAPPPPAMAPSLSPTQRKRANLDPISAGQKAQHGAPAGLGLMVPTPHTASHSPLSAAGLKQARLAGNRRGPG